MNLIYFYPHFDILFTAFCIGVLGLGKEVDQFEVGTLMSHFLYSL